MILITGATGFIGHVVCKRLSALHLVRVAVRDSTPVEFPADVNLTEISLNNEQDWHEALSGISTVVHCAARVHVMNDKALDPMAEYRKVNVEGTLRLAHQAAEVGVKRFIFISSIKVNGEATRPAHPFTPEDVPAPQDPYGVSKMEAEEGLRELSTQTGMEVVIIRPPLVYGRGVKANFASIMRLLKLGVPMPLGGVTNNLRSFVYVENLVDLIRVCLDHPRAANQTFLVSDDEDVSTTSLLNRMAKALGSPARLVTVSPALIKLAAKSLGRNRMAERLCGSLQVDITKTKELLSWQPKFTLDEGLLETCSIVATDCKRRRF